MAKAKRYEVEGVFEWAQVFEDNRDMDGFQGGYVDCDGAYSINVLLDEKNAAIFKASGTAKTGKMNKDGKLNVKVIRKHKGPFTAAGGPPMVVWKDGTPYDFDSEGTIGNGSSGKVMFEVYGTKAGINGTRLVKVTLHDHVVYEPEDEEDYDEVPV